jgi:hypothetical protein
VLTIMCEIKKGRQHKAAGQIIYAERNRGGRPRPLRNRRRERGVGEDKPQDSVHQQCVDNKQIMRVVRKRRLREIAVFGSGLRRTAAGNAPSADCR